MLDTAETILRDLAGKMLENEWTVKDVFDHPKLIHVIPEYEGQDDVVAISAQNYLGRMYQLGFQDITQIQVACMMRVIGKPDIDNAILFDDLKTLLESYGVPNGTDKTAAEASMELPEVTSSRPGSPAIHDDEQKTPAKE